MKNKLLIAVVVALLAFTSVPVSAANSPTAVPVYSITVDNNSVNKNGNNGIKVDGGKISVSNGVVESGKTVTFKATPNKNRKFVKWIIKGSYKIVDGSLTNKTITIIPDGDIDINAKFKVLPAADEKEPTTKFEKIPGDDSTTSPQTGAAAGALALALLASGGIAITSKKKFSK